MANRRQPVDQSRLVVGSINAAAWMTLASGGRVGALPPLCWEGGASVALAAGSLQSALMLLTPKLLAMDWVMMIAAMMLPLLGGPLRHVRDRSFTQHRRRRMLLFTAGYVSSWILAGLALEPIALAIRSFIGSASAGASLALASALLWQVSPAKQWFLNRCHRRPALAAFGVAADRDALRYGLASGAACIGTCWALMLLPLLAWNHALVSMVGVTLFAAAERLERPAPLAWRWRLPGRASRLVVGQASLRLGHRPEWSEP